MRYILSTRRIRLGPSGQLDSGRSVPLVDLPDLVDEVAEAGSWLSTKDIREQGPQAVERGQDDYDDDYGSR